jgi:hypothetical protein
MKSRLRKQSLSPPEKTRFVYVSGVNPEASDDVGFIQAEFLKFGPLDDCDGPAIEFTEGNVS